MENEMQKYNLKPDSTQYTALSEHKNGACGNGNKEITLQNRWITD